MKLPIVISQWCYHFMFIYLQLSDTRAFSDTCGSLMLRGSVILKDSVILRGSVVFQGSMILYGSMTFLCFCLGGKDVLSSDGPRATLWFNDISLFLSWWSRCVIFWRTSCHFMVQWHFFVFVLVVKMCYLLMDLVPLYGSMTFLCFCLGGKDVLSSDGPRATLWWQRAI